MAAGTAFEPGVRPVGADVAAMAGEAMASPCREQTMLNLLKRRSPFRLCTKSGAQVMLGRREAVAPLPVSGRGKNSSLLQYTSLYSFANGLAFSVLRRGGKE